jgi:hypothetical protein
VNTVHTPNLASPLSYRVPCRPDRGGEARLRRLPWPVLMYVATLDALRLGLRLCTF